LLNESPMKYQIRSDNQHAADREAAAGLASQLARQELELNARRHNLKDEIANEVREGRDSAEYSADQTAFGINAALLEATGRTMRGIEAALERLRSATYGTCLDCGSRIPSLRLKALPFAERCRNCQELHDEVPHHDAATRYRTL